MSNAIRPSSSAARTAAPDQMSRPGSTGSTSGSSHSSGDREDLPADEVIVGWTQSPRALDVLAEASAVVHLSGVFAARDWETYEAGNVATTRLIVGAVSPTTRLVYLSYLGADPADDKWYVRSKGQAEDLVPTVRDSVTSGSTRSRADTAPRARSS